MTIADIGKILIVFGVIIVLAGLLLVFSGRIPLIGRLPGDIEIRGKNFVFYFPITTMVVLSVVLSLILWFVLRR